MGRGAEGGDYDEQGKRALVEFHSFQFRSLGTHCRVLPLPQLGVGSRNCFACTFSFARAAALRISVRPPIPTAAILPARSAISSTSALRTTTGCTAGLSAAAAIHSTARCKLGKRLRPDG